MSELTGWKPDFGNACDSKEDQLLPEEQHCHGEQTLFLPARCNISTVRALIRERGSVSHPIRYPVWVYPMSFPDISIASTWSCTNAKAPAPEVFDGAAALPLLCSRLEAMGWEI